VCNSGLPLSFSLVRLLRAGWFRTAVFFSAYLAAIICCAQDLAPRTYVITPIRSNAVTLTYSLFDGSLLFEGTVPNTDATARTHVAIPTHSHSLTFFRRSANFTASLPYGVGNFRGTVVGAETLAYRSGLLPATFRFSVNLNVAEFRKWQQKTILGVGFRQVPQTGQYDPTKLMNLGTHRWTFKPELGYSQRWGHWILDAYGGAWFYTTNPEFFSHNQFSPGTNTQTQARLAPSKGILATISGRLWVSLDGNCWFGGTPRLNGAENSSTLQRDSRVAGTASIPLNRRQSIKFSYSKEAYIRYGGNFQNASVAWQYSWLGRP
jgi:hypothetical protein